MALGRCAYLVWISAAFGKIPSFVYDICFIQLCFYFPCSGLRGPFHLESIPQRHRLVIS
jgi:hypothetical protein